jgi:hypothetical protein
MLRLRRTFPTLIKSEAQPKMVARWLHFSQSARFTTNCPSWETLDLIGFASL